MGRWPLAALVAFATLVAGGSTAGAERVRTTGSTEVYKRTGEQSPVVTKIKKGTTLDVIATDGRWLKVRVNGRTGWVPRASVVSLEPATLPRNTRRQPFVDGRSVQRDVMLDAPDDRVGADAVGDPGDGRDGRIEDDQEDGDDDDVRKPTRDDDDDRDQLRKPTKGDVRKPTKGDDDDDRDQVRKPTKGDDDRDDVRKPTKGSVRKPTKGDDDDRDEVRETRDDERDDERDGAGEDAAQTLTIRVAKTRLYPRPSDQAEAVMTLREGDQVVLLEEHRSGKWLRVEIADEDAASGYIAKDSVTLGSAPRAPAAPLGRAIEASARLGFATLGGTFTSNGTMETGGPEAQYPYGSNAVSLAIAGEATFPIKPRIVVGGSVRYLGCVATGGITYGSQAIGFSTHDVDLLGVVGYDLRHPRGISVWGRAGLHVGRFSVALNNPAKLPVEAVLGPMLGAGVRVARVTPKLGAEATFDVMPTASRAQTANQTDGQLAATRSLWLQLAATYALAPRWQVVGGYQLGYAGTRWAGASDRHMGATGATRTDLAHVFNVGVARPF